MFENTRMEGKAEWVLLDSWKERRGKQSNPLPTSFPTSTVTEHDAETSQGRAGSSTKGKTLCKMPQSLILFVSLS